MDNKITKFSIFAKMKYGIVILIFFWLFRPLAPIVEYVANYDYIANELCENKDNKKLNCKGKCYLSKEIAKTQTEESTENKPRFSLDWGVYFFQETQNYPLSSENLAWNDTFSTGYPYDLYQLLYFSSVFHPPILV